MTKLERVHRCGIIFGSLVFLAALTATAAAGGKIGIPKAPCNIHPDTALINGDIIAVGEEAAITIRVGSDGPIRGFQFYLQLPSHVAGIGQIRVVPGCCPFNFGTPVLKPGNMLLINTSAIADPVQINTNCVFLTVYISTHCWNIDEYQEWITWILGDPDMPSSYLVHTDCQNDPFDVTSDDYIWFHNYVRWTMTDGTGLYGDLDTLTVNCNNTIAFSQFRHHITYGAEALELVDVLPLDRTAVGLTHTPCGTGCEEITGTNPSGFGTEADGLQFYRLVFRIISHTGSFSAIVDFAPSPREMIALDCGQLIHQIPSSISYNAGHITIPPFFVDFVVDDAIWNDYSIYPATVEVPLRLKNNLDVTGFRLALKYIGDVGDNLRFLCAIPSNGWDLSGADVGCPGQGYRYALLINQGTVSIPASDEYCEIGRLFFTRHVAPDPNTSYSMEVIEVGCNVDATWVLCERQDFDTTYTFAAPETVFDPGTLTIEGLTVWIDVPGANAGSGQYSASTAINVKTTVELASLTFEVPWSPDEFCVGAHDLQHGAQMVVDDDIQVTTVTIPSIPASDEWVCYGYVRFTNASGVEQWGDLEVTDIVPVEAYPSGYPIHTVPTAGSIHVYADPGIACLEDEEMMLKQAAVPLAFGLLQNRPNPFNASTVIEFSLAQPGRTKLEIYNVTGQRVATVLDAAIEAGRHNVTWDGCDAQGQPVASGIYFYRLKFGQQLETRKMVLMK